MKKIELKYYDQIGVWDKQEANPLEVERAETILELIPNEANSILDVGCGKGIVTNYIQKPFVVGIDFARTPLNYLSKNAIRASIESLPIKSMKFDLVLSTEVFEHLGDSSFQQAVKEIKELKANYLLIGTPYLEDLDVDISKCSICKNKFHISHHYRSFNTKWFAKEFPEYELIRDEYSSYHIPTNSKLVKLMHKFGVYSYSEFARCDKCGGKALYPPRITMYAFGALMQIDRFIKQICGIMKPYNNIILLKRKS